MGARIPHHSSGCACLVFCAAHGGREAGRAQLCDVDFGMLWNCRSCAGDQSLLGDVDHFHKPGREGEEGQKELLEVALEQVGGREGTGRAPPSPPCWISTC